MQQTYFLVPISSKPDNVPNLGQPQQTAGGVQTAGPTDAGPDSGGPSSGGPAVDGPSMGGGQAGSGAAQSGRSTLCLCPMCKTTVTHPIGVPCSSLNCPVCGSRLINAEPAGASGGAAAAMLSAGVLQVAQSKVVQVSTISKRIVIPSPGRSLKSDIAPLFDRAPYFLMFGLGKYEVVKNPYYRDPRSNGAEIAQYVVGEGGAIIICNNVSMDALRTLKDLQVRVYSGFAGTVQQALDIYSDGRLKDSGTTSGLVIESSSEHEGGGGGPPASKNKSSGL